VDEADSLLIDEAVTPLIISAKADNRPLKDAVRMASGLAETFHPTTHYIVRQRHRDVEFTTAGEKLVAENAARMSGLWAAPGRCAELLRQALTAREFYHRGHQYMIERGRVVIVDEFTGRPMPDRSWRQGLHQAVEAWEGLELTDPSETLARISFQRFFRQYHRLSGMTGTAAEVAGELWHVYGLAVIPIPVNRPCRRITLRGRNFPDEASKREGLILRLEDLHARGVPVLVGTRSVRASEELASRLREIGLIPQVLNATRLREEAIIIAEAGQRGQITIATNMAGRGTDIRLGTGVVELGGLHVLSAERSESARVDRQLIGRCARQGDPGVAESFISAEDELLRRFIPAGARRALAEALRRGFPGADALANRLCARAQAAAQRQTARQRRRVLEADDWLENSLAFSARE
jgi:preprotein translocase subunit SecA